MDLPARSSSRSDFDGFNYILQEIRDGGFDSIIYASYRTGAKLHYIRKKCTLHLIDLWNVIEAFRENGLNGLDRSAAVAIPKLESVLVSLYISLNKRLPQEQIVNVPLSVRYLLSWLLLAYDSGGSGRIRLFSVKVALVTLCNGKPTDKLRYIFSQISDSAGVLILRRFQEYLEEVLALPAMVLESPTFAISQDLANSIFIGTNRVMMNGFLGTLLEDPVPLPLIWMPLMHAIGDVENVIHAFPCNICNASPIQGFRYKCQKCHNFNLCQNCFWQGKVSDTHRNDHEVKEYSSAKPDKSGFRDTFRNSFRCVPKYRKWNQNFPDQPEQPLNLTYIVPPSPIPTHNGFPVADFTQSSSVMSKIPLVTACRPNSMSVDQFQQKSGSSCSESESDDEHRLIARYAARLASEAKYFEAVSSSKHNQGRMDVFEYSHDTQREIIAKLEARNQEILREIGRLQYEQGLDYTLTYDGVEEVEVEELLALRYHKTDLEDKLAGLKESRRQLQCQIEALMVLLHSQREVSEGQKEVSQVTESNGTKHHRSAPTTPLHHQHLPAFGGLRSAQSYGENDFDSVSSGSSSTTVPQELRRELLDAADYLTNAMSSLVQELQGEVGIQMDERTPTNEEFEYSDKAWDRHTAELQLAEEEKYLEDLKHLRVTEMEEQKLLESELDELCWGNMNVNEEEEGISIDISPTNGNNKTG